MSLARRRAAIATLSSGLIVALCAAARADQSSAVVQRDLVEVSPARGVTVELIDIDNRLGDVSVEGQDRDSISILAVKRAPDQNTMDQLRVSLVPDPSGPINIKTSLKAGLEGHPIPPGSVRIDLVILAPRHARVRAQVWKGQLGVKGMENGADLVTEQGDIDVTQVSGAVTTQSGHGRHRFEQVYGAVDAQAVDGDMDLDLVRGDRLAAVVHMGDVIARRIRVRDLSVRITRGSVRFEGEVLAGGRYAIASYWGNVEVKFGSRFGSKAPPMRVRARTRSGGVNLPARFRHRREGGVVTGYASASAGTGDAAEVDLRTRVGMITLAEF